MREYSPHAWGWTGGTVARDGGYLVFPTRVGMDRTQQLYDQAYDRIPPTRGDGPE